MECSAGNSNKIIIMWTRVLDRFQLDHSFRDRDIHVGVVDGVAKLTSEVWLVREKLQVSDLVRSVSGMNDVRNGLTVRTPL